MQLTSLVAHTAAADSSRPVIGTVTAPSAHAVSEVNSGMQISYGSFHPLPARYSGVSSPGASALGTAPPPGPQLHPLYLLLDREPVATQDGSGSAGDRAARARLRPHAAVRPGSGAGVRGRDPSWPAARRPSGGGGGGVNRSHVPIAIDPAPKATRLPAP